MSLQRNVGFVSQNRIVGLERVSDRRFSFTTLEKLLGKKSSIANGTDIEQGVAHAENSTL